MVKSSRSSKRKSRSHKVLTVKQLQKLAKKHGVTYAGLKKASLKAKLALHGVKAKSSGFKKCKKHLVRDRVSHHCRKSRRGKKSMRKSRKHRKSHRKSASKRKSVRKSRKPCKSGQRRSHKTHRCRKPSYGVKKSIRKSRRHRKSKSHSGKRKHRKSASKH